MAERPPGEPPRDEGDDGPPGLEESLRGLPLGIGGAGGPGPPDRLAFLRNPFILAALALVGVLLVTVIVLVFFDIGGGDSSLTLAAATGTPAGTPSDDATQAADFVDGVVGRVQTTATIRNGPSSASDILGTLPAGFLVFVTGRNESGTWLQVEFPSNSPLRGWLQLELVEVAPEALLLLTVAGPGTGPDIDVPTSVPRPVTATPTLVPTETPALETPSPSASPTLGPPTATPATTPAPPPTSMPTNTPPPVEIEENQSE
ncbi:MAG: SH3 domain-containing protein [Chloroflexi bacterium]|nr:SH3 domain-containing protein [Chloroflexota bacterium]